jgi:hypothetical protein
MDSSSDNSENDNIIDNNINEIPINFKNPNYSFINIKKFKKDIKNIYNINDVVVNNNQIKILFTIRDEHIFDFKSKNNNGFTLKKIIKNIHDIFLKMYTDDSGRDEYNKIYYIGDLIYDELYISKLWYNKNNNLLSITMGHP